MKKISRTGQFTENLYFFVTEKLSGLEINGQSSLVEPDEEYPAV